ncbi:MAG: hypothetical protein K8R88_00220 [Armatimonadetes bacterium]|nr:hypothetical protein [Armatimonadota bacterium]
MTYRRIAVIMAGGSGERFWPLSRKQRPKQLLNLASESESMIEQTVNRLAPLIADKDVYLATAPHLLEPSKAHLAQLSEENFFAEPHKRNTAGCMVWLCANLLARDPNARENLSMTVVSADHLISPIEAFCETLSAAFDAVESNKGILTIGITPDRPETGYGYLQMDMEAASQGGDTLPIRRLKRVVEKPDLATAQGFLDEGGFVWNSGIFVWTLDGLLTEMEHGSPVHYDAVFAIADALQRGAPSTAATIFETLPNISYDYAIGEKAKNTWTVAAKFDWDDVGAWDALERTMPADESGNVCRGPKVLVDTTNSIIVNENPGQVVAVLGLDDIVVVTTPDAILVCAKKDAQRVRAIVGKLSESGSNAI